MQPNSEPTPADVAMVAQAMGDNTPAPQPQQPVQPQVPSPQAPQQPQMQPSQPTPQPAPTQQPETPPSDPFAQLFAQPTEPTAQTPQTPPSQPTEPSQTPQPSQPTEPTQPAPQAQPPQQPQAQPAPQTPAPQQQPQNEYQTFDEYMEQTLKDVPQSPPLPDAEKINPEDPAAIKQFFDDLVNTAVARAEAKVARQTTIQASERRLWDQAFDKYGSLRTNKSARDLVHNIRMGYFQRGVALTPTQAADKLLESMGQQYRKGVADNQVQTTIENVQPNGTGGGTPVETTLNKENTLLAVQTGGETALAEILDAEIKAGRL